MRIDAGEATETTRDELKLSRRGGSADWRVLLGLALAVVLSVGSFLAGRNSVATDRPAPQSSSPALVADVLGGVEVQATINFLDGTTAMVVCSPIDTAEGGRADMRVIHVGPNAGGEQILSYSHLASVTNCAECNTELLQLAGEPILLGGCEFGSAGPGTTPFPRRVLTTSSFVISSPAAPGESVIGVDLLCGITNLSVQDDELVLEATQARYAGNPNPPVPLPPMRFTREGGRFEADDIGVLEHFCAVTPDTQLVDLLPFVVPGQKKRELSHLVIDSEIGDIGFRNAVLIGLTANQCNQMARTQLLVESDVSDTRTLAELTGLEPPEGYDDWFFTCQIDSPN